MGFLLLNGVVKESRDGNLSCRFWRLSIFHFPLPLPVTSPTTPTTKKDRILKKKKDKNSILSGRFGDLESGRSVRPYLGELVYMRKV